MKRVVKQYPLPTLAMAVLLGTAACLCSPALAGPADTELARWRAERRATIRASVPDKSDVSFKLLVIPVDFADHRLPGTWDPSRDLTPRIAGFDGETLERCFSPAHYDWGGLRIVLSPLVHLDGAAADYYDITGYTRTRALAAQAIAGADAAGVPFASADADQNGRVDGVLILHAAPGLENDPTNGRVKPLQYYLTEPYLQDGIEAQHYAVASLHSGPGIWAHETGHLLGLEDRYHPFLSPEQDSAMSRGGLGIFSLMAAGAWGRGDGTGAALLDAYSAVQLGWVTETEIHRGSTGALTMVAGEVVKLYAHPADATEYFLLQLRGGFDTAPYDAAFPEPKLVVYHVDETVPDDAYSGGHLRVSLIEADGVDDLTMGDSPGTVDDMFPDATGVSDWSADTTPSTAGYGSASGITCRFHYVGDELRVEYDLTGNPFEMVMRFVESAGDTLCDIMIQEPGHNAETASVVVSAFSYDGPWGRFEPGTSWVQRDLQRHEDGTWYLSEPIVWCPAGLPPPGAFTYFAIELYRNGEPVGIEDRIWLWREIEQPLSLGDPWSNGWAEISLSGDTIWQAWPAGAAAGLPDTPLLACTGTAYTDGASWPDVTYQNNADARILSPMFFKGEGALRVIHVLDAHTYEPEVGPDGALIQALMNDGEYHPLQPLGGYTGTIDSAVQNPLHGHEAFIGSSALLADVAPLWRVDVFPLGSSVPDWTRLKLRLGSDPLWRGRGWLIARFDIVPDGDALAPFATLWDEVRDGVALSWPWEAPEWITLEASVDHGRAWTTIWEGDIPTGQTAHDMLIPAAQMVLPTDAATRHTLLRARVRIDVGEVVSRTGRFGTPAADPVFSLGAPRSNPGFGAVSILVQTELFGTNLGVYDLRGRLVREWWLPEGTYALTWDGRDNDGRAAPSGVYMLRLSAEYGAHTLSRKVTLLR